MPRDFKTILCPTDFSEASYRALDYAVRFAKLSEGTLLLAHVVHVQSGELRQRDGHNLTFDEAKQRAQALLEEVKQTRIGDYQRCELIVEIGDPTDVLIGLAEQRRADLIVISTHGRTGIGHLMMGSVAEKIIRHAPCPVFVVRRGAE